jgi:hypothetical protein
MADLNDGARAMEVLRRDLLNTAKVRNDVAWAILKKARTNAAGRPTPQARMVAAGMTVPRGKGVVIGFAGRRVFGSGSDGVKLGLIAFGSEFGSTHKQFGAPWTQGPGSGYWLHPAAEGHNPAIDTEQERHADQAIDAAIRSAGP